MANNPIPLNNVSIQTSLGLIETLQTPKLRTGGASSSLMLNKFFTWVKRDLLRLSITVADASENTRRAALTLAAQNAGLAQQYQAVQTYVDNLEPNGSPNRAIGEYFSNTLTVADDTQTTADVNPLFGQVTLPARSRQNVLVIERPGGERPVTPKDASLRFALQPTVTGTLNAVPPADYLFGEDPDSVFAFDGDDATSWLIEDPTSAGHVAWLDIYLPGDVSGGYRCNELELIPLAPFNTGLFSVQADVIGQGWRDLDFSYLGSYDATTGAVARLAASRLCFAETSVRRFRLGFWVAGTWGFTRVRVLHASYASSAQVTTDFASVTSGTLLTSSLYGKRPTELAALQTSVSSHRVTTILTPSAAAGETPVLTATGVTW